MEKIDYDIDDFMDYCTAKNLAEKTINSYEQTLRLLSRYLIEVQNVKSAEDTKELHIREYIKYLQDRGKYTVTSNEETKNINFPENREDYGKKIEITTINNYIRNIKVFYNYLYKNRYITSNPVTRIKEIKCSRKVVGFIKNDEFNRLLRIFDLSKFHEYRDYIITQLIFDTGMRLGETLLIQEKDIDYINRTILLPSENTKGKKDRYVFFSEEMLKQLRRWLKYKDRYRQSEYIFCTNKGKPLSVSNYETNFKKYGVRIGLEEIHPHMLRNNFAKRFLMQGGDIYTLSRILGHSSVKVTEEAYLDLDTDDLRTNYQRFSPLANLKRK
ncbi:site-specific recombinase phage integrase family [Clostridium sp. CAG:470]|nr:MAG: integrase [Clostridium sp. 28_17]CDE14942.1 site-specific recombinase phage integrase family [Clostridium sp. CAG:470]